MVNQPVSADAIVIGAKPDDRTYLEVPFSEKTLAKTKGARWDPEMAQWYCPQGTDIGPLRAWVKGRTYLTCPFSDKSIALELGARWDRLQKKWYVLSDQDHDAFRRWLGPSDN